MSEYLLSKEAITKIDLKALLSHLSYVHNLPEDDILILIKEDKGKVLPGIRVNIPIKFARGVIITVNGHPASLIEDIYRDKDEYFMINPDLTKDVQEKFQNMEIE